MLAGMDGVDPDALVTTPEELRDILGEVFEPQVRKVIDHLDAHCRAWIARSPFIVVASAAGSGDMDVSPKGDPPGFVRVLTPTTLAVPDRPGNRRADTYLNVLENPEVAIMFPKSEEAPINGDDIDDESAARANVKVNVAEILGDDVYAALAARRRKARRRLVDREKLARARAEREACSNERDAQ